MTPRPSNPPKLTPADLRPGDVILSRAPDNPEGLLGLMDKLILELDEGDYTHGALYVGREDGEYQVVEGIRKGILCESLDVDLDAQELVDVYRFQSPDGKVLGDPDWPAEPVIVSAKSLVGGEYSYLELGLMAAMLLYTDFHDSGQTQIEDDHSTGQIIQQACDLFYKMTGKTAMTCVQVVTTAFFNANATPAGAYALQANETVARIPPKVTDNEHPVKVLNTEITKLAENSISADEVLAHQASVEQGTVNFPPVFTPRDLQLSPSLKLVGTLKQPT